MALPGSHPERLKSRGDTGWVFLLALQKGELPVHGEAGEVGDAPKHWPAPTCPSCLSFPHFLLKKRAGNVPATALLPPGTYAVSCWKARMSQGDSQTYFRPFLSLNACARRLYSEQRGPSKAAHTNVLYFEKVYSFNGDSFNWALPSLGAIKWHLLAPDWKATVHAAPSYPAPAALLCITASHSDLTNLIHV